MNKGEDSNLWENVHQASKIYILPNVFTTGNLFFGFLSIILCIQARFHPAEQTEGTMKSLATLLTSGNAPQDSSTAYYLLAIICILASCVLLLRRPRRAHCPRKRQNVVIRQGIRLLVRLYFIRGCPRASDLLPNTSACGVDVGDVSQPSEKYRVADRIRVHVVRRNTAGAL